MINKNDEFLIEITSMSGDGSGIGHHEGMVVFVSGAVSEDIVKCHIIKVKKNYYVATIKEFIKYSPMRIKSDCEVSASCGGCVYRDIDYKYELEYKYNYVYETLKRIGGIDFRPAEIISGKRSGYRNKASYPVRNGFEFGFYKNHTHSIVPYRSCPVSSEIFHKAIDIIRSWGLKYNVSTYNEESHSGLVRHVVLRYAEIYKELMVILVLNGSSLPHKYELIEALKKDLGDSLKSVQVNINKADNNVIMGKSCSTIYGSDYITDRLCGLDFRISPLSFYQVNRTMAERLYEIAAQYAKPDGKIVLDLYCGTGTIGLTMAAKAKKVIGIEIVPSAIKDARQNAEHNGIVNAEFICADAAAAKTLIGDKPDVIILDPPRKGADSNLLSVIADDFTPERIVYISCDPATLARDIKMLAGLNYDLKECTPVDMFPGTRHVECVALLTKKNENEENPV